MKELEVLFMKGFIVEEEFRRRKGDLLGKKKSARKLKIPHIDYRTATPIARLPLFVSHT